MKLKTINGLPPIKGLRKMIVDYDLFSTNIADGYPSNNYLIVYGSNQLSINQIETAVRILRENNYQVQVQTNGYTTITIIPKC